MEENIVDRISQLPECIVHHILSCLKSPVDLVRIKILSKTWFALAASFPILDFHLDRFIDVHDSGFENERQLIPKFFEYVAHTISKFCEQNVSLHTLKLVAEVMEPTDVDIIKRWIGLIINKDVKVLELSIHTLGVKLSTKPLPIYRLPNTLLSASSLTSLTISGCELPSSLMVDGVKFKSLKSLSLDGISIDEEVITYLTTNCPLLKEFIVKHCYGFKRFCVYGHRNLQKVKTFYGHGVERIDIEAPNLHYLALTHFEGAGEPCINLSSCKKLTTLYFRGNCSSISNWFAKFFSNFPLIENLFLDICIDINNNLIKVSSVSLRKFRLHLGSNLEEFEIDAPNLLSFEYSGDSHPVPFPLASTSGQLLKGCMRCYPDYVDADWFYKLRRFLDKNNGFKVLKLHIWKVCLHVSYRQMIQSPPFELEHVELKFCSSIYEGVVDVVLRCCRPQSLSLRSRLPIYNHRGWSHVVKYTYERLLQQEGQGQGQTYIQLWLSSASKAEKHFSNLKVLLKALNHDRPGQTITFIKTKKRSSPRIRMRNS